jgi:hypothetical protein
LKKTIIRISLGTTPLKKIPSVTQTSLLVGKGSLFGPLSRTPPQKIAVLGYKHFILENRNISINMGTEALVDG